MLLSHRSRIPEIMDGDRFTAEELAQNLADLRRYNRVTGMTAAVLREIRSWTRAWPEGRSVKLLDVGSGGGDIADEVTLWARARGFRPVTIGADTNGRMLDWSRSSGRGSPERRHCEADASELPFEERSVDIAWSTLLLHHLDEEAVIRTLYEMRRVTRTGFIVVDLRRSPLALACVWTLTRLTTRSRLTLHDAPLSVRRSLKQRELWRLAVEAGLNGETRDGQASAASDGSGLRVRALGTSRLLLTFLHPRDARRGES